MNMFWLKLVHQQQTIQLLFSGSSSSGTSAVFSSLLSLAAAPFHRVVNVQMNQNWCYLWKPSEFRILHNKQHHKVITVNSLLGWPLLAYLLCVKMACNPARGKELGSRCSLKVHSNPSCSVILVLSTSQFGEQWVNAQNILGRRRKGMGIACVRDQVIKIEDRGRCVVIILKKKKKNCLLLYFSLALEILLEIMVNS